MQPTLGPGFFKRHSWWFLGGDLHSLSILVKVVIMSLGAVLYKKLNTPNFCFINTKCKGNLSDEPSLTFI